MTHTPFDSDAARAAILNSPQLPSAVFARTADAPGMNEVAPEVSRQDQPDPSDEVLVDQAGRPLGPRALQTKKPPPMKKTARNTPKTPAPRNKAI